MIEHDPVEKILNQTRVNVRELIIDFAQVPHEDPLAYAHGFFRGFCEDDILADGRSAKAGYSGTYLAGYKHGRRVAQGYAKMPLWASEAPNPSHSTNGT